MAPLLFLRVDVARIGRRLQSHETCGHAAARRRDARPVSRERPAVLKSVQDGRSGGRMAGGMAVRENSVSARMLVVVVAVVAGVLACAEEIRHADEAEPSAGAAEHGAADTIGRRRVESRRVGDGVELVVGSMRIELHDDGSFDRKRIAAALDQHESSGEFLEVELVVPAGVPVESLVFFLEDAGKVAIVRTPGSEPLVVCWQVLVRFSRTRGDAGSVG